MYMESLVIIKMLQDLVINLVEEWLETTLTNAGKYTPASHVKSAY